MKKIYLTFDIEPIVSGLSFNPSVYNHILLSAISIAEELKIRGLKATFYISLSRKTPKLNKEEYYKTLNLTIKLLSHYSNIDIQPHLHCYNLPVSFETNSDSFGSYSVEQQTELLKWSKDYFNKRSIDVSSFRPGSYSTSGQYYRSLQSSGFRYSSVMLKDYYTIDFQSGAVNEILPYKDRSGIIEYPVTSLLINSVKRKKEIINLSPDFLTLKSVIPFFEKLNYININFHSFSMYSSRLARENHEKQFLNNLLYLSVYKPLQYFTRKMDHELIEKRTVFNKELLKWLDFISERKYDTYFIGEE